MNLNTLSTAPSSQPTPSRNALASDVEIKGTLRFVQEMAFDGNLDGEIVSEGALVIGKSATVKGEVRTKTVTLYGTVIGNITVTDRCELKAGATLNGDLKASRILVEEGATFIGKSEVTTKRSDVKIDPSRQTKPASAPVADPAGRH